LNFSPGGTSQLLQKKIIIFELITFGLDVIENFQYQISSKAGLGGGGHRKWDNLPNIKNGQRLNLINERPEI
jgi:hypothetical protein